MRVQLSLHDLTRVGLAAAADPMWELASSVQLLRHRDGALAFSWWRRWARHRLPESAQVLTWLCGTGPVPGFLLPAAGRHDLEAGLAAVLETEPRRLADDLRSITVNRELPAWASALAEGDTAGLRRLVPAMRDYFEAALAPHWDTVRTHVDADREMRTQILLGGGVEALLSSLRPMLRWRSPTLEASEPAQGELLLDGTGLLLAPAYFTPHPVLTPVSGGPARLVYPAVRTLTPARSGRAPRGVPDKALAALLGPTRAAALAILATGCSTSELAARLGVTPSAISKHTSVLREAGLIITHRERNTVLHSLTPLGSALLES